MQQELINAYPILKTSNIVRLLGNLSDIMGIFIDTKPQDFYREIKDTILDTWEKNQIKIKELFDKIEINCNIKNNLEKEEFNFSYFNAIGFEKSLKDYATDKNIENFLRKHYTILYI